MYLPKELWELHQVGTTYMCQGDKVSVYADVEGGCKRGFVKQFDGATVFVGNGIAEISRQHLFCTTEKIRGVAIRMTEPLYEAPSLSDLSPEIVFPQNLPSIVCTRVLDPQPGERILDMCAAPGGKTTHVASLMKNQGWVVALDKSANKREKLLTNVQHWSASCVDVYISDSSKCISGDAETSGPPLYPPGSFDRVLLDAPCSALGQRPSCRNKMTLAEVKSYPALQRKIFTKARLHVYINILDFLYSKLMNSKLTSTTHSPEVTLSPEATLSPETASPEATLSPATTPSPEVTPSSKTTPSSEVTPSPATTPSPEVTPSSEVTLSPATTPSPEVTLSPATIPSPQATPSPATIPSPEVTPSPETTPHERPLSPESPSP
ncbi:tRNA (cytosine(72)-C(5))-methyltransferase NSUN6 [Lamellibrachia satsuma]|nr:tRNA (cytosine(72)-C(5))-methyltransferase NSUN6 [Lamellibrachia satsuma]